MTEQDYGRLVQRASPRSPTGKNLPMAFCIGGAICVLGQLLLTLYIRLGAEEELAPGAVSVTLVFLSALLTGLNVYDDLAKRAGAGTLVPITGFANAVVSPAMEFRREGLIFGVGAKMFAIAGPVLVYGIGASVVYGVLLSLFGG